MNLKLCLFGLTLSLTCLAAKEIDRDKNGHPFVKGEYIVKFKPDHFSTMGLNVTKKLPNGLSLVTLDKKTLSTFTASDDIEYIEPNYIYTIIQDPTDCKDAACLDPKTPNDPMFPQLYGIKKIGAPAAWKTTTGSRNIKVAVIDTGIDPTHPDLVENVIPGWDSILGVAGGVDQQGHGTHVAGTIGAVGNNGIGVVGVNWQVTIMSSRFLDENGSGSLDNALTAIDWAVNNGAVALNNSWGGGGFAQSLFDSIKNACDKGVTFVAAAGNDGEDNDKNPTYPASYKLPCIISVATTDKKDELTYFSNFGKTVSVAAPGMSITSTALFCSDSSKGKVCSSTRYATISGTSMATPHVTGAVALLKSIKPELTPEEVKVLLQETATTMPSIGSGRINLDKAIEKLK